jgi:hypothetical protein
MSELTPQEVLEDLLGSADFPVVIVDTRAVWAEFLTPGIIGSFQPCSGIPVARRPIPTKRSSACASTPPVAAESA